MGNSGPLRHILDFVFCACGFITAFYVMTPPPADLRYDSDPQIQTVTAALTFWLGLQLSGSPVGRSAWVVLIEQLCLGTGLNLIAQSILAYAGLLVPTTLLSASVGSLFTGTLLAMARAWVYPRLNRGQASVLLVGYDAVAERLLPVLGARLIGVVADDNYVLPRHLNRLGEMKDVAAIVDRNRPATVVINLPEGSSALPPALLFEWRKRGLIVEDAASIYERTFLRVCVERLTPADLLRSPVYVASRPTMAVQAVYSNLLGLILLLTLAPVILVSGVLARLAAGSGPFFEHVECAGFQGIPFLLLRLRTRKSTTGELTWAGQLFTRLRLVPLPQLINLVRGEIAVFGPRPARRVFAEKLTQVIPFYAHRFTVKPGLFGWAQVHAGLDGHLHEELMRFEYDLYYIRECTPSFDFEILLRTLLGIRRPVEARTGG